MDKRGQSMQHGLAMIEAALCLVVLLPVALAAIAVSALIHDLGIARSTAEMVLQEHKRPVLMWQAGGGQGSLQVSDAALRAAIKMMVIQGTSKVSSKVIGMKNISALGCYMVYHVDTVSGALDRERYRVCDAQGNMAFRLSIDEPLQSRVATARGIAVAAHEGNQGYFESVVLLGLVIGGEYSGIALPPSSQVISSGVVDLPSREVSL